MTNIKVLESAINLAHAKKDGVVIENKVYTIHDLVDILVKDLKRLEKLEKEYYSLNKEFETIEFENYSLRKENEKLKQAIEILKDKLDIKLEIYHNGGCVLNHKIISNCIIPNDRCLRYLEIEQYKVLKEVLGNE